MRILPGVSICRFGREFEFSAGLIEQLLSLLRVTLHVEFIGLLRCNDSLERLLAEALGGREIRMPRTGNIVPWPLGDGAARDDEQEAKHNRSNLYADQG